ncbi:glycosylphosphatidylinositol anchor biosynthesis [Lobosporangium transversale]|uniref:Mannosyltransferase n=1 Tax=Lobosporangium transversale TaxID=64571 RepID=A0A1Y2GVS2_9FUNG|nr:Alg9-like mannosyltransferase family-domain-containing protein [Lobosporangium transversale]KAF9913426.1 glycosylphosphatidylinositol anchor biosynthesis [Lobosporangium transversale]ORZ23822.1 Alg9-like mannosyltransferase family-domain-containing protein [Lobosporangium transversale]|eukprot:XP_021883636.1 Alg9-like mannosyltransferase family-domain-containing protein [Lobosporangium transversale]
MSQKNLQLHRLSDSTLLTGLILFRALNACLVQTYFSPDEYWQALEVGHKIAFGSGYLTWEWDVGLRSVLHPVLFAALYKTLAVLGLDDGPLIMYAPRLLQSIFAAIADFYAYRFADRLFQNQVTANWTLFLSIASWWNFFCSTRTLANSMEAALTIVALYYWPFATFSAESTIHSFGLSLMLAFLTCIFRPTAAIIWVFLGVSLLIGYIKKKDWSSVFTTMVNVIMIGGTAMLASAILDSTLLYHQWILTPLNFLRVNVLEGISLFYGSSPWHWYLSQGLPLLFGIYVPFVAVGSWRAWIATTGHNASLKRQVLGLSLWTLVIYSSLQHKEWRFLYPILYPLLPFAADTLYRLSQSAHGWRRSKPTVAIIIALVTVNVIMAWYTTLVHQRGVIDVMEWIRQEAKSQQIGQIGFIMPCHSTPWQNSVHRQSSGPLNMWFITCDPPLGNADITNYKDESDVFYADPVTFMNERIPKLCKGKMDENTHLVLFEDLVNSWPGILSWLQIHGYHECARFFNSHFHDDSRRRGDVLVYCRVFK